MEELKGLILSGGAGTRLRPITHTSAKQLVPVANKPVLYYGIEALVDSGIGEIGIVVSPETGAEIEQAVGDGSAFGARITYIQQDRPLGLAHALLTASEFLGESPFVMYLGDNLLRDGIASLVERFRAEGPDALILLTEVDDPSAYGVAVVEEGRVVRLVEKPTEPPSNLALVGVYMFGPAIFDAARAIEPSNRGELEITDAIQEAIDAGKRVESQLVTGWWKDTGELDEILEANRLVLQDVEGRVEGDVSDSEIDANVVIEAGASVERSKVVGPTVIASGARISDSRLGPNAAIAEGVLVDSAEVSDSIVLSGARVANLEAPLRASLVGRDASIEGGGDGALRAFVGDRSSIIVP